MKRLTLLVGLALVAGCSDDAYIASKNLSKASDNFEVDRRVIFYNGINGEYILTIEGRCSIDDQGDQLEVVCKNGEGVYKKHFLGLSDNVTYFAEQLRPKKVGVNHYRVTFKPQAIIPDVDLRGDAQDILKNQSK